MKELLFSFCTVSLFSSAVGFLCPKGNEGMMKTLRLLLSLCVCASLIFPMIRLLKDEIEIPALLPEAEEDLKNDGLSVMIDGMIDSLCSELEDYVSSNYDVKDPSLTLEIDRSDPSKIKIVKGHLKGSGELEEASSYISGVLLCKITYEEG